MPEPTNSDLRTMVRDLAKKRDSIDRRQLYFALIQAVVWTPVTASSAIGHLSPGDLHPLDCEGLDGLASFSFFTHEGAAENWQAEKGRGSSLRLERIRFTDLLPLLLDAGAGSAFINPEAKFSGELYRHELETMLDGARKLARRSVTGPKSAPTNPAPAQPESASLWSRIVGWWT